MHGARAELFLSLAESSSDFVALASLDGALLYLNAAMAGLLGTPAGGDVRGLRFEDLFAPEDRAFAGEVIRPALLREGRWNEDYRLHDVAGGRARPVRLSVYYLHAPGAREPAAVAVMGHDISVQRRAEVRLRTLVESGPSLAHSLDYHQTLANLAELVVRALATFCVIDVFTRTARGMRIERIASYHVERRRRAEVAALSRFLPDPDREKHPAARVLRDGTSSLVEWVDDDWIEAATISPEHAAAVRALGLRSLLAVPIVANGKILGALTCALAHESRERTTVPLAYDAEDLFFVEELGRRGGIAIENALTFEHERAIAVSLQAASLPVRLPGARGVRLHADYRPGNAEATIGGDWYDALILEDGSFVFTIGDVVGNGLRAAIVMTKLRQAMQSAAMVDSDPNVALSVADQTLRLHDPDGFATALAARYDPVTRRLRFASAGHPPPLLRHADGRVEELRNPGILLGMRSGEVEPTRIAVVPIGAALIFYTDGLTEATRDMAEGQRRLQAAAAAGRFLAAPDPARALVAEVLEGFDAGDDVAVLVATFDHAAAENSD